MKIKVGGLDLFEAGTIVSFDYQTVEFVLDERASFFVRFVFKTDNESLGDKTVVDKVGENGLEFTFINYNSPFVMGNPKPLKVGRFKRRALYLNYSITSTGKTGKTINYSWYLGEEVKNG